jgi:phage tail-like protein
MADWRGRGKGRAGSQPSVTITGGAGRGGGRGGSQPSLTITGGAGRGGGRSSTQPKLQAKIDFGGASKLLLGLLGGRVTSATTTARGNTSIAKSANGEKSPRVADPEGNYYFALEIDNTEVAQFREASGLKTSTAVFELEEGGMNHRVHKLPGQSRWDNITLRYGVSSDVSLLKWRDEILEDQFGKRRNGSIVLKTLSGDEVRRYSFVQGWPVAWEGPSFNADSAELAIEMIEIAHHGIQVT